MGIEAVVFTNQCLRVSPYARQDCYLFCIHPWLPLLKAKSSLLVHHVLDITAPGEIGQFRGAPTIQRRPQRDPYS
jgi:hypothetical protein